MAFVVTFLYKDSIFHTEIEEGQKITIGSGKKNTIMVPELQEDQIVMKWKGQRLLLNSKMPYPVSNQEIQMNHMAIIDQDTHMAVHVNPNPGVCDEQVKLPYNCVLKLGRSKNNHIVIKNPYVSGKHLVIRSESGIVRVEDVGSTNGTFVNGKKITQVKLHAGDVISILGINIKWNEGILTFENCAESLSVKEIPDELGMHDVSLADKKGAMPKFHRSPRTQEQLPEEPITLATPPAKPQKFEKSRGIFTSLLGSGAMLASSIAMGGAASPAFLAARAASMVSPIANVGMQSSGNKKRKKQLEEYEKQRRERYGQYIQEQKARIEAVANNQREILTRENPSPEENIKSVKNVNRTLWERTSTDRDFLDVRLGMGYDDICVPVKSFINDNSFQMENDDIRDMAEEIIEETRIVDYVPARVKLRKYNTVGIIGERRKVINEVYNLLVNLTTAHFFRDVKIVGIFDEKERDQWAAIRWLPHIWDNDKQRRFLAFNKEEAHKLCECMQEILEERKKNIPENGYKESYGPLPHFIFILGSREYMEDEIIMKNLTLNRTEMGVSSIFLFDHMYQLPHECQFIIDLENEPMAYERDKINQRFYFTLDQNTNKAQLDEFARTMSAIQIEGFAEKAGVPDSVTFLQGYGVKKVNELNVMQRWENNFAYRTLAAPIGTMAGNKTFALDIQYMDNAHGPHGLVAGTTGSGKSELLQSWILSMAVNYHPHDVNFVLIDYKGGGMANLFERLPHMVGKVTNISSNISRSLISLERETKRRLRILSEYQEKTGVTVNDINKYHQLYKQGKIKEPLPHLIIVVDEFAELKKEEPDFMAGLVSIARVGRSLGIHLILATQKPSGVVDDQIWSNSKFKLCLKVQDTADSREMLKKPDAASITRAGRCYVQVGNDQLYELFQSYWSGADYSEEENVDVDTSNRVRIVKNGGMRLKTVKEEKKGKKSELDELTAVVNHIAEVAKENDIERLEGPWLPELPEYLPLTKMKMQHGFDETGWRYKQKWLQIPIGMYDSPETQSQGIQCIDFQEMGHIGIYGAPSTGKTTLLKTIMFSIGLNYTPEDVQIYGIDCGGWSTSVFSGMPHVGGIALDCEQEKVEKLEKLLKDELEERKKIFLKHKVSTLAAYRESVSEDMPAIILVIDNFPALFELYPDIENFMVTLATGGATYGVYLLFTANSGVGVRYKIQQAVKSAIAFELTDKGDYAQIIGKLNGLTLPKIMGRAFIKGMPPIIFQSAIYMDGDNERERSEHLNQLLHQMNEMWKGKRPKGIPVLPQTLYWEELTDSYLERTKVPVGIICEDISICYADLTNEYHLLVTGTIRSGKSKYLEKIARLIHAKRQDNKIYIFDGLQKSLMGCSEIAHQYGSVDQEEHITEMLNEIIEMLNRRKHSQMDAKKEAGDTFSEKDFIQSFEQICVFIDDLKEFVDTVSDQNKLSMERICRLAQQLGVMIFTAGRVADISKYNEIESLTRVIVGNQKGLLISGNASMAGFYQNDLRYNEKSVELQEGEAYFFNNGKCRKIKPME